MAALCFLTWALLSPDPFAPIHETPLGWLRTLDDLLLHGIAFGCLSALLLSFLQRCEFPISPGIVVLMVGYSLTTEILQMFVPGRTCDPIDGLANLCGMACGFTILTWTERTR